MNEEELKKLDSEELVARLIEQTRRADELEAELTVLREQLAGEEAGQEARKILRAADMVLIQKEHEAEARAEEIIRDAELRRAESDNAADRYWETVSHKLEKFYDKHEGLREMLEVVLAKAETPEAPEEPENTEETTETTETENTEEEC